MPRAGYCGTLHAQRHAGYLRSAVPLVKNAHRSLGLVHGGHRHCTATRLLCLTACGRNEQRLGTCPAWTQRRPRRAPIEHCRNESILSGHPVEFLAASAEARLHINQPKEALDLLEQAKTDAHNTGDNHFTAELHRLTGECLLAISPRDATKAEACFHQALRVSRNQQAKSLELRAAMSMARLWQQQSKNDDGRRLVEAKALLVNLDQPDKHSEQKVPIALVK